MAGFLERVFRKVWVWPLETSFGFLILRLPHPVAPPNSDTASRDSEDLMRARVKMQIIIDAVPPRILPTVRGERFLKYRCRVQIGGQRHRRTIEN